MDFTTADERFLDRMQAQRSCEDHYPGCVRFLDEIVNYGTRLIPQAMAAGSHAIEDHMLIAGLFTQVLTMIDAVAILAEKGAGPATLPLARTAYEASLCMAWILKEDTANRARHYYVAALRQERVWAKRGVPETPESDSFAHVPQAYGLEWPPQDADVTTRARGTLSDIDKALQKDDLGGIDRAFDQARGSRRHDPRWYEPLGKQSLRQLAKDLGLLVEYEVVYPAGSLAVHSSRYLDRLRTVDGGTLLLPLRHLKPLPKTVVFVAIAAKRSSGKIIDRYVPDEKERFLKLWKERWAPELGRITPIDYHHPDGRKLF